jgi:hypothetical protein
MSVTGITVDQLKVEITSVRTTITAILLTGSSYVRPGFSLTRANLKDLQAREQYLIRSIIRDSNGIMSAIEVSGGYSEGRLDRFNDPQ